MMHETWYRLSFGSDNPDDDSQMPRRLSVRVPSLAVRVRDRWSARGFFAAAGDDLAGEGAGVGTAVDDDFAVDDDVGDAERELLGLLESCLVDDGIGIEQRDVGPLAFLDAAALFDAELV